MNWTYRQHSFAGGLLDADLMGRQDVENYYKGASRLDNFNVTRQGFIAKRRGSRLLVGNFASRGWQKQTTRIIPIVKDNDDGYYLFFNDGYLSIIHPTRGILLWGPSDTTVLANRVWATGTLTSAECNRVYKASAGIGSADVRKIDYCQIGDTIYLVSSSFKPKKVTVDYVTDSVSRPVITVEEIDFGTEKYNALKPVIYSINKSGWSDSTSGTKKVYYRVSYVDTDGFETFASTKRDISYEIPWPEGGKISIRAYVTASAMKTNFAKMRFFKDEGSGFGYIGECTEFDEGETGYCTFEDDYITPDLTETPRDENYRHDFTSQTANYPQKVAMANQRLVYARDANYPFTLWFSCIGLFNDFTTHESVQASDSIDCTLSATEMPRIFHVMNGRELMVFTESGEWIIKPTSGNALTPTTVSAKIQSSIGTTEYVKPIMVGNEVLFTDQSSRKLYATAYDLTADSYNVKDMSAMTHFTYDAESVFSGSGLTVNGIWKIVYRESPDSQVYCLLNDGTVGVLTYNKAQNLMAWSHTTFALGTGGDRIVCHELSTNKAVHSGSTEVLMVVTNGNTSDEEIWMVGAENPIEEDCALTDAVSMDGMRELTYTAGTTNYLPVNMMAVGKATGAVFRSGSTSSTRAVVTEDVIAGYPVEAHFESVYPDAKNGAGEMQGEKLNATDVTVRVCSSSPFKVGQVEQLVANDRTAGKAVAVTAPVGTVPAKVALQDGDVKTILAGSNGRDSRIRITHDGPWPLNVMSIGITYQVEGENLNGGGDDEA